MPLSHSAEVLPVLWLDWKSSKEKKLNKGMRLEGLVHKPMSFFFYFYFFTFFSFFFFNYNVYMFALGSQEYFRGFFVL